MPERRRAEAAEVVERLAAFRPIKVAVSPDDRILMVYGACHIPIPRHAIACSPKT